MEEAPIPFYTKNIIEFSSITDKQTKLDLKIIPTNYEIEFFAKIIDKNPQRNFYLKENENNLLNNAYLSTGGNIIGIVQILEYYIKKNAYKTFEENNSIKIEINIEHPIIKNIYFTLLEEKKDINQQVSELSSYIYETLVHKIKSLEEKNKDYEKKFQELNNEYQKLIEINKKNEMKINNLEEKIKDLNIKKNEMKINNLEEKIIDLNSKDSLFNSKIKINESLVKSWLNNRKFNATLLFRMTEDGNDFNTFHQKCDNKGKTITFIETQDGLIFGGYTELEWDSYSKEKYDNSTFIFSFNYNEKYTKRNNSYSIYCFKGKGPTFGWGPQIGFEKFKDLTNGLSFKSDDNSFVLNNKFTNGKACWNTKELEIYQINYY